MSSGSEVNEVQKSAKISARNKAEEAVVRTLVWIAGIIAAAISAFVWGVIMHRTQSLWYFLPFWASWACMIAFGFYLSRQIVQAAEKIYLFVQTEDDSHVQLESATAP